MAFNRLPGVKQTTSINSSVSALASAEPLTPVAPLAFSVCAHMHVCTCLSVYIPERMHATVCVCGCVIYFFFPRRRETLLISTALDMASFNIHNQGSIGMASVAEFQTEIVTCLFENSAALLFSLILKIPFLCFANLNVFFLV